MKVVLETHYRIVVLFKFDLKLMLLINKGGGKMGGLSLKRACCELGKHGCTVKSKARQEMRSSWNQVSVSNFRSM